MAFELNAPHRLEPADARARLQALGDYLGNKYGLTVAWTGDDTATVSGSYLVVSITGTIELRADEVRFSGKDPGPGSGAGRVRPLSPVDTGRTA